MNILIVDDNIDLANGLREILSIDNHDIDIFYNAEDALISLKTKIFDAAFIDVKLPGMNGVELFRIIKENSPETHLFLISGYRITQIIEECTGIANTNYINEHSNDDELLNYVNNLDATPLSIAFTESDNCIENLNRKLKDAGKKALITSDQQPVSYNFDDYDILIFHTSKPLIYSLINFIALRKQGNNIPTILVSNMNTTDNSRNKLHSLQLTGCIFKPFQLENILDIVSFIETENISDNRNSYIN